MSVDLRSAIWQACELLTKEKSLITIKNIKLKLLSLGHQNSDIDNADHDLTTIISDWRIAKLNLNHKNITTADKQDTFNIYQALAIPRKEDKNVLASMQKKIFSLEYELNKYKHAACRASQKNKLLEKKLHTIITNAQRERHEVITNIKRLLTKPSSV